MKRVARASTKRYYRRADVARLLAIDESSLAEILTKTSIVEEHRGRITAGDVDRIRVARNLLDLGVNPAGVEVALALRDRMLAERRELLSVIESLRRRLL